MFWAYVPLNRFDPNDTSKYAILCAPVWGYYIIRAVYHIAMILVLTGGILSGIPSRGGGLFLGFHLDVSQVSRWCQWVQVTKGTCRCGGRMIHGPNAFSRVLSQVRAKT